MISILITPNIYKYFFYHNFWFINCEPISQNGIKVCFCWIWGFAINLNDKWIHIYIEYTIYCINILNEWKQIDISLSNSYIRIANELIIQLSINYSLSLLETFILTFIYDKYYLFIVFHSLKLILYSTLNSIFI